MRNEKHVWLHKKYRKLKKRVNSLYDEITHEKSIISYCIIKKCTINLNRDFTYLRTLRNSLKELEKEIRIVKQLIKEVK